MESTAPTVGPTRRRFLQTTAAAVLSAATMKPGFAQAPTRIRKSLQSGNAANDLAIYKRAVEAMLKLPPDDPRNWYRNAFTHLLDCPHGNWWFLVWHRAYLGWFEETCRELSNEPDFALPYWDWSVEPAIPTDFWDGALDPNNPLYEVDVNSFENLFRGPVEIYWNGFSMAQLDQQRVRRNPDFDTFWTGGGGAADSFFPRGRTRRLTEADPDLDAATRRMVSTATMNNLLGAREYVTTTGGTSFETGIAMTHHGRTFDSQSILEGQPHNNVHGSISGYMRRFLSPVDPIFIMHHCNIDRLWDVWTRKQQNAGRDHRVPIALMERFNSEEFLFFHDAAGDPVTGKTAGDYFEIGDFNYTYEPGTGEDQVGTPMLGLAVPSAGTSRLAADFDLGTAASASVALPTALAATIGAPEDRQFFADVSFVPPSDVSDLIFDVFVAPKGESVDRSVDGDNFAGRITFFGHHHDTGQPASFRVALTAPVERLRSRGALAAGDELEVSIVPELAPGRLALSGNAEGVLTAASIGVF